MFDWRANCFVNPVLELTQLLLLLAPRARELFWSLQLEHVQWFFEGPPN